ncbi:MAG: hypothetical protein ACMUHX_06975 [bacterium]
MKRSIVPGLCVLLVIFSLQSSGVYANEPVNDLIQDPNYHFVFSAFSASPNVPGITEDPNDKTSLTSLLCYGCHQPYHILDPSDPNHNLWRAAGAAPIYGDQVDGIEIADSKKRNHHPMGTQARLTGAIFVRAPGAEATENLNNNNEITCISCHKDFHGVADGTDYDQRKENNFLRWDFTDDNAEFCIKCHIDKTMVNDGKHFRDSNSGIISITRKVFDPTGIDNDYEKTVPCRQCMFCHFIHDGEERENKGVPGSIRADIDALMRIGPANMAWGDRTTDADLDDYEDMCYGCHGAESIVGGQGAAGSLLDPAGFFTHPFAIEPQNQIDVSMFPVSDGNSPAVPNDYGSKEGQIFCGTCHDVHRATNRPYLRSNHSPYEVYGLCEECHEKDREFSHPIGIGPNINPAQGKPTGTAFVDTYNGGGPLFSQGGSGRPGGITSPYDPVTGESILGGSGKVVCLTCHNVHAAVTSWEGGTKNDPNMDHGHLLVKDNMRNREQVNAGSELCKACHSFGDSEYSFPEGAHGGRTFSHGRGICSACHIPHGACGPKLWSIECPSSTDPYRGCYCLGPFKGVRQLCFCCHNINYVLNGSRTVFKGINIGNPIPEDYPEDHVMSFWADIEGVKGFDPDYYPLDSNEVDTIPTGLRPDPDSNYGFYCGTCHNPHLQPDSGGGYYLRSKDGTTGNFGQRRDFCEDCHTGVHDNEDVKDGECLECHNPHGGLTRIDEAPDLGRLILTKEFSDILPPEIIEPYPSQGATQVSANTDIIFYIEDPGSGVDPNSIELFVQGINLTSLIEKEDEAPDKIRVICHPPFSFRYGEPVQVLIKANDLAVPFNTMEVGYQFIIQESSLTEHLTEEGCWQCHQDMYPDLAINPNSPAQPNLLCFTNQEGLPNPLYYSTLDFKPIKNFFDLNPSGNFTDSEIYKYRKKGHLSHLVYQPFGLGRGCLDCHNPARYTQADSNSPHPSDHNVYFKDGEKLDYTTICSECHGGFYPKENIAPNIDNKLKVLQWGDPGSVTCLQCHDDSYENGGIYASYLSRYCSFPNRYYDNDPNGCLITAPDPDKVPGQNYWPKSGHGVTKNPHSNIHDLNLDTEDGRKNFCWECHWSNETVREKVCVETLQAFYYPDGFPIGKYNGHLDTAKYRDERWGAEERSYPNLCLGHRQWDPCRECHPKKYSHFVYKVIGSGARRESGPIDRYSHCIVCHNPHGSGDEHGKVNVFMIKGRIYKQICNNCHYSQFPVTDCDPFADFHADPNRDTWVVNFFDPLKQDIREPDSSVNSISIPTSTKDICEVCHQDNPREYWPNPGDPYGNKGYDYKHRNGSRHYFNTDNDSCPGSDSCTIDYRGTDCTGCHIHDPGPTPDPNDPDYDYETSDSRSVFNSKAFAPTCRCHGIGRIDIATFTVDGNQPVNSMGEPLFGKGHGTPPPPFPVADSSLPEKDPNEDVHMAHARYNFPCIACHIDPNSPLYDPNDEYIFVLDDYTPIGLAQYMNPNNLFMNSNGIYERDTRTCSNLYCHSNAKGIYAYPISWSAADKSCRDPNNPDCLDDNGRFLYCNNCHKTPPDPDDIYHSRSDISCDTCHPHNGVYEGNAEFYKHVNGKVDFKTIEISFPEGWSMISLPMQPNDASLSVLFPEAEVVYKFEKESGYVRVKRNEDLQIGEGYWILFNKNQSYVISGNTICSYDKTIHSNGWEMIGGCTFQARALVDNGNIKVIYSFVQGKGYIRLPESEDLMSGKGYWILIEDITEKALLKIKLAGF